ncbi:autotransporter outer membrane beta-barrel domain-containing protein [Succinivibrio dextrinosolvens]|uniref:autotransporter outer membrane beta-barrel domain-containing protein n=1 Tax=Succinivibrio dextrinosolvens TaxID=83771 RepID=UPI0019206233|nr:autotransporter outer membrane beta-barrel domain-containing protein [Succinivibrio dextrinosolvens]
MACKRDYSKRCVILRTPIARCISAIISSSLVVWPAIAIADSGGEIIETVLGGSYVGSLGTTANHVIIDTDSTSLYADAIGGYSISGLTPGGLVRNNVLEVANGGTIKEYAFGGYAKNDSGVASSTANIVSLKNGSTVMIAAYGGKAESKEGTASTTSNRVDLASGATVKGTTTSNRVDLVTGAIVNGWVVGGESSSETGTAWSKKNLVTISGIVKGNNVKNAIYGGSSYSAEGTANSSENRVIISKSGSGDHAYGGYAGSTRGVASATSNILNVAGVVTKAYGGYTTLGLGEADKTANTINNILTISGSATDAYGGYASSRKGTATVSGNTVIIEHGGLVGLNTENNALPDSSFTIVGLNAYGGWAEGSEYNSDNYGIAIATGNQVIVKNGAKLGHDAYGGIAYSYKTTATASGNTVYLDTGINLNGSVYGGYAHGNGGAKANNNTVILGTNLKPDTLANAALFGGFAKASSADLAEISGNTLEIWAKNLNVKSINNFDNYYFILPAGTQNGDTILKIIGGTATALSPQTNFTAAVASGAEIYPGSRVTLINNENGINNSSNNLLQSGIDYDTSLKGQKGVSLDYDFIISNDANNVYATVVDINASPKTKAVMEGRLGGLGVLNLGADLATGEGMRQALGATEPGGTASGTTTVAPFAAVSAGKQRLVTGSHVNVNSISGLAGVAARKNYDTMSVTGGGFFEFGYARNKTFNSTDSGDVNGKGNAHYYGLGLLSRLNLTDTVLKNMYFEGSVRFGRIFNDWHTNDMVDRVTGKRAEFDSSNYYYGIHMGLGYVLQASDKLALDMYGKLLWSHLDGKKTKVAYDQYKFADIDSWRSRVGTRAGYTLNDKVDLYTGVAWEHEFNGDAKAKIIHSTLSYDVPSPSTRGNSAVIDFGVAFNSIKPGLTLGAEVTGYIGKRQGLSGSLQAKYEF